MDLLNRARSRGEFERFATRHADSLLRSAYLMVGDRAEAEDILQECLWRLARSWPRVRSMEHPAAYARRVLVNLVLDRAPKHARRSQELRESQRMGQPESVGHAPSLEQHADLLSALAELPMRQRAVLVLRYFGDLPEVEVARILDCSLGTVKSAGARGLERLRERLEQERGTGELCGTSPASTEETR